MPAETILIFCKSGILRYSSTDMVNVYQRIKFEANIFINDRDTVLAKNQKFRMAAAAILNFGYSEILVQTNPCMVNVYPPTKYLY